MLKLTLAEWNSQAEGEVVYVNPSRIGHVAPRESGCYVHLGDAMNGYGYVVKESAEEVARMVDGAGGKTNPPMSLYEAAKELVDGAWWQDDRDGRGPRDCVYGDDLAALRAAVYPDGEPE